MPEEWDAKFEALLRQRLPALHDTIPLGGDANLQDLGMGSLEMISLVSALETEYDIALPDEALVLDTFETPVSLWRTVRLVRAQTSAAVDAGSTTGLSREQEQMP